MASKKKALDGKTGTYFWMKPEDLVIIGLDTKHKSKADHPQYDPRINLPLTDESVTNVMLHGVIEPVVVKKDDDGNAVLIDGRQRVRRAREANKRLREKDPSAEHLIEVKCVVERGDDERMVALSLAANTGRTEDSILVKAANAVDLMARGKSEEYVAATLGCSITALNQWLALLEAPAEIRKAAEEGVFSETAMVTIATLPPAQAKEALAQLHAKREAGEKVTVKDAKAAKATVQEKAAKEAAARAPKKDKKDRKAKPAPEVKVNTYPAMPKRKIQSLVLYATRLQKEGGAATEAIEEGLAKLVDEKEATYLDLFMLGMRVACGDRSTGSVKGLNDLLDEAKGG